jgi:hypothetical protein
MSALRKYPAHLQEDGTSQHAPAPHRGATGALIASKAIPAPFGKPSGRRKAFGIVLVLLIHVVLLILILRSHSAPNGTAAAQQGEIVYMLEHLSAVTKPAVQPPKPPHKPKAHPQPPTAIHEKPVQPPEVVVKSAPEAITVPTDMMAMINAARERRHASDTAVAQENAQEESTPSETDYAANIKQDLQNRLHAKSGTNGMFQILSKGVRNARFSFRGWTTDSRDNWRQTIEVDAGPNGDVERAIVRKMIEIIRQHYKGNFNWESRRLGRVIPMSARLSDNADLEAFLLLEFFSQ